MIVCFFVRIDRKFFVFYNCTGHFPEFRAYKAMNARIPTGFEPIGHITRSSGRRAYMRFCLGPMASEPIVTSAVALHPSNLEHMFCIHPLCSFRGISFPPLDVYIIAC